MSRLLGEPAAGHPGLPLQMIRTRAEKAIGGAPAKCLLPRHAAAPMPQRHPGGSGCLMQCGATASVASLATAMNAVLPALHVCIHANNKHAPSPSASLLRARVATPPGWRWLLAAGCWLPWCSRQRHAAPARHRSSDDRQYQKDGLKGMQGVGPRPASCCCSLVLTPVDQPPLAP